MTESELYKELSALTKNKNEWETSIPDVALLLESDYIKIKAKALWLLGEMGLRHPDKISPYVETIAGFITAEHALLRERALNALGRIGRGDCHLVKPYLPQLRPLAQDQEPTVRLAFIWACENIATNAPELFESDMPLFTGLLHDENSRVRIEAPEIFRVLGKRKPSYVTPYLSQLQDLAEHDQEPVVRVHAKGAIKAATQKGEK